MLFGHTWHVFGLHFGGLEAFRDALGLHFGGLGIPLGTPRRHFGAFGMAWGARGPQDVLFEAPVRAAALLCWGQAARLGGPGIQDLSKSLLVTVRQYEGNCKL